MVFAGHFWNLLKQPGFHARVVFGEGTVTERDRKALAVALWTEVTRLFQPVTAETRGGPLPVGAT